MSIDPVLAAEKQLRLQRIEAFLQSNVWLIGTDRPQTRQVLVELLALVPEELLNSLFTELRLLVIAPRRRTAEVVTYRGLPSRPTPDAPFVVVTLDWNIEGLTRLEARREMARILGDAFVKLSGHQVEKEYYAAWGEQSADGVN